MSQFDYDLEKLLNKVSSETWPAFSRVFEKQKNVELLFRCVANQDLSEFEDLVEKEITRTEMMVTEFVEKSRERDRQLAETKRRNKQILLEHGIENENDLKAKVCSELREICRQVGFKRDGNKQTIVSRLNAILQ